jgi:hypothetical protein
MKGIEAVLPVCWFHSAVLGARLNIGALSNSPIRKLAAARTSASLSLSVITKTTIVRNSPHLTFLAGRPFPNLNEILAQHEV